MSMDAPRMVSYEAECARGVRRRRVCEFKVISHYYRSFEYHFGVLPLSFFFLLILVPRLSVGEMPVLWDADDIIDGTKNKTICLRITDSSSITPFDPQIGFEAASAAGQFLSTSSWVRYSTSLSLRKQSHLRRWLKDADSVHLAFKHVLGGWNSNDRRQRSQIVNSNSEESPSPWISTSASFEWTIWEIARRLSICKHYSDNVQLSIVRRRHQYSYYYRGPRMFGIDALDTFIKHNQARPEENFGDSDLTKQKRRAAEKFCASI